MTNPQLSNIPGAAVMSDTLDFVKSLWGSMSVPGLTAPTLSVDELDKKINDLKAVEAWLTLNMSMLRGSIQALEVQRGTIATLKSVGASLAAAVNTGAADNKSLFEAHPYASAFFQHASPPVATGWPAKDNTLTPPGAAAAAAKPAGTGAAAGAGSSGGAAADAAAQMANPAMWWNLLQDQFKQAVSSAMTSEAVTGAAARASDAAAKFAAAAASGMQAATTAKPTGAPKAADAAPDGITAAGNGAPMKKSPSKPAAKRAPAKPAKE